MSEVICWREVEIVKVLEALKEVEGGKVSGLDGIAVNLLKYGGETVKK